MRAGALAGLLIACIVGARGNAHAHPLAPSVLTIEIEGGGRATLRWRAPTKRPSGQSLRPRVPEGCESVGEPVRVLDEERTAITETIRLACAVDDLTGTIVTVDGFEDSTINAVVRIVRPTGEVSHAILDADTPRFAIPGPGDSSRSFVEYLRLGVEHLLTGWDHLTFVVGLLILYGWQRRLIAAVTAFTLGHSLTLALSVLGVLEVPQALVEAMIAATIVVLALEIESSRAGPVYRHPWLLPGSLGLLHGLGFASVLFDAGLPSDEIPVALLGFNLGLELGQLAVIAVAWAAYAALRSRLPTRWRGHRAIPAYVIGSLAAFWVIERTLAALGIAT